MYDTVFTFNSYSEAAKADTLLRRNYIYGRIVRTGAGKNGRCGYSIRVGQNDYDRAYRILYQIGFGRNM